MNKKIYTGWIMVFVFLLAVPGEIAAQEETDVLESFEMSEATMNWTTKVLRVKGNGVGPERVNDLGRRKILAMRAAKMDAFRNLLETVKGVYVNSQSSVEDLMLESDSIRSKTHGMLKGWQVVDVAYTGDGACEITVEVNIDNKGGFLLTALNDLGVKVSDDYPTFDWVALREDLEQTKTDLARTRGQLATTQKNLRSTQSELVKTGDELSEEKDRYARLRDEFEKKRDALAEANARLIQAEARLDTADSREEALKDMLTFLRGELKDTRKLVADFGTQLSDKSLQLVDRGKELSMTRDFLKKKEDELIVLGADLENYRDNYTRATLDIDQLKGYIRRLRDLRQQTCVQVGIIQPYLEPAGRPSSASSVKVIVQEGNGYTGILLDARGLNPKPVLAPAIITENREKIYGTGLSYISVSAASLVDYIPGSIDNAKTNQRIGNNPLVIKPIQVVNNSDLMISREDVGRIGRLMPLLTEQKVGILL